MALKRDPEWAEAVKPLMKMREGVEPPKRHDVAGRRQRVAMTFGALSAAMPDTPGVDETKYTIKSHDGAEIDLYQRVKKGTASDIPQPAILHFHGGGMVAGSATMMAKAAKIEVDASGVQTFDVEYRLAPEFPDPTPVEDCYAALLWLHEHAKELNLDSTRIAVAGESAGGGLAAGVSLLARDRKLSPPIAKQILIYPMLDDRTTNPNPGLEPLLTFSVDDNVTGWTALLGEKIGKDDVSPYAVPARATSVESLPPAFIDTSDLDLFRDEDIAYAARLAAANINVELHVYPGVPHAFEVLCPDTDVAKKAKANRLKAKMSF